jgi:hypothetical protein
MSRRTDYLSFGPSSLARLECSHCRETTLHRLNRCIHCGTQFVPPAALNLRAKWNGRTR